MGKIKYRTKRGLRKALAALMTFSMVVTAVQVPAFAASEEVAESTASVSGVFSRKIVLDLLSEDLRVAALAAIRDNNLFDAKDYLGATSDNKKAKKEYEAFFNENPGLYVVEVPSSVADVLSGEADAELRIFVQKDQKKAKVDLSSDSDEIIADDPTLSKEVEFRYGSEKDIILYEPSSDVDTLVNGGEDAYYREPEQDMSDNSDYELSGNEKITFMFVNKSDDSVRFTLKVDGIVYDKVDVSGRDAALKKILAEAGIKKTEETTKAVVETTAAVTVAPELVNIAGTGIPTGTEIQAETMVPAEDATVAIGPAVPGDDTTPDTGAVTGPIVPTEGMEGAADAAEPKEEKVTDAAETESETVITETVETAVKTDDQTQVTVETDETVVAETADHNSDTENGTVAEADVTTDSTGTENNSSDKTEVEVQADTEVQDSGAAAGNDTADNADSEVSSEANVEENDDTAEKTDIAEKIQEAVQEATDKVADVVLGRMVAWADTIVGEDYEFDANAETPDAGQDDEQEDTEKTEDVTEAVNDTTDTAKDENDAAVEVSDDDHTDDQDQAGTDTVDTVTDAADVNDTVKSGVGNEASAETDTVEFGVGNEAPAGNGTEEAVDGMAGEDVTDDINQMLIPDAAATDVTVDLVETAEAVQVQETEAVTNPVASPSEIEKTEYDDFAKGLIAEVKEAVKEDREAAKESIMVAKVVQYTLNELGRIHYETETDGYSVDVFAERDVFGGISPTLEVKKLYKPEEANGGEDVLSETEIAELKDKNIYENSQSLDIHFVDGDGNEVEPTGPVKVRITVNDSDLLNSIDASTLEVHHIKDTSATLTTEKVAATDDVKVLDANDETISDSELETNAGAITAGEEAEVVVSSAVAEFEVDSFSTFTITWTTSSGIKVANIKVHYVDENGKSLFGEDSSKTMDLSGGDVVLADAHGGVTNYDYKEARLGSTSGDVITAIKANATSGNVDFVTAGGSIINSDNVPELEVDSNGAYNISGKELYYRSNNRYHELGNQSYSGTLYVQSGSRYNSYSGPRYNYVLEEEVFLIYTLTPVTPGADDPQEIESPPETTKTLTPNKNANGTEDGTYTLTLTVKGKTESQGSTSKANVLVVLDTSGSMGYSSGKGGTRLRVAKNAVNKLAEELLANNKTVSDTIELGLITFSTNVNHTYGKTTSLSTFSGHVNAMSADGGTNWEAALLAANQYDFEDDDPVHIIFVSDGAPTYRKNANGYTKDKEGSVYGEGDADTYGMNLNAAQMAAEAITNANKQLYTIYAFGNGDGGEAKMKSLFVNEDEREANSFDASGEDALNEAFAKIISKINKDLSYANVTITDGMTNLTASVEISGGVKDYVYEIEKADGTIISNDNVPDEIKTAGYDDTSKSVVWNIGGENANYKLEGGSTYKVSFVVWPTQEAYDEVARLSNDPTATSDDPALVKDSSGNWSYKTNTGATVSYQTVNEVTQDGTTRIVYSKTKTSDITPDPDPMSLTGTQLDIKKIWKLDDESQHIFLDDSSITLSLQQDDVDYRMGIVLSSTGATTSEDGKEITWSSNENLYIAPGILVSKAKGDGYGFPDDKLLADQSYYLLETGHDYKFTEKSGNHSFILEDRVYHPMLVDGVLMDVTFTLDDSGSITGISSLDAIEGLTELVATNVIHIDTLKVYKKYTGNMALPQETHFELKLFEEDGTTPANYGSDYILGLNENVLEYNENGYYTFTIVPVSVGEMVDKTIILPKGVKYQITEVKDGTPYSDYTTKWGTDSEAISTGGAVTTVMKLGADTTSGEVNKVYFENNKTLIAPTGINTDVNPFTLMALAGLGSLAFLAYDFRKRRLFEDE